MFAKLLKHEWRATRSIIALLCVIILISGLAIGGTLHYMMRSEIQDADNVSVGDGFYVVVESEEAEMSTLTMVVCILLVTAGVIAIAVCCVGSVFFLIYRFYKRCFTDEGYLTFTLPVSNHQILLSSLVNCILGQMLVVLTAIAAVVLVMALVLTAIPQNIDWTELWVNGAEMFAQLWDSFVKNIGQFTLVGFSTVFAALSELIVLMLAITIGAMLAKKHKILAAVAVYYGITTLQSLAFSVVAFSASTTQNIDSLLASPGILGIVTAIAGYLLMHWLTSRKLNLV